MILDDIAQETRKRIDRLEREGYYDEIRRRMKDFIPKKEHAFYRNLKAPGLSFICELKKASPSKGIISEDFPFEEIAKEYERAGASAISCLTEPKWFKGDIDYLRKVASEVEIPVLRKDFIIDPCQIEEAALAGASAILLIAAILTDEEIKDFMKEAENLGLDVLAEAHDEKEMERLLSAGARIVGVNNRDLRDFTIHMETTERLAALVPEGVLLVSESGMTDEKAVKRMRQAGADAVLIGWPETDSPEVVELDAAKLKTVREQMGMMEQYIRRFSAMERKGDVDGMTDTLIRITERVAEVRRLYQPGFPLPTFAEIRRVVQDEWDEDMGKIDPQEANTTADQGKRETDEADSQPEVSEA